jgi:hypothetical protein
MENQLLAKLKNNKHIIQMIASKDLQNILIDLIERQKQFNDKKVRQTLNNNSFKLNDELSPLENAALFESNQFQEFVKEIIVILNDLN